MFLIVLSGIVLISPIFLAALLTSNLARPVKVGIAGLVVFLLLVVPLVYFLFNGS